MRVTDRQISLDAAKLLGLPFTWGHCVWAYKFVHGAHGLEVWERGRNAVRWIPTDFEELAMSAVEGQELLIVEFEDEQESCDVDR